MNGMMRRAGFFFSACFLKFSFGCQMLCSSSLSMAFCFGKIEWGLIGETLFLLFFFFLDLKMSFVLSSSCHSLFLWILFQQVRESSKDCLLWLVLDANIWMELLTKCNVNVCVLGVDRQMPWMDPAFWYVSLWFPTSQMCKCCTVETHGLAFHILNPSSGLSSGGTKLDN